MTMKKMIALTLAVVMCLSLAATAFAADITDSTKAANVKVTGTTTVPTISIEVPTTAAVVLNPYAMKLKNTFDGQLDASGSQEKVISPVYAIVNKSNIDIKVGVTATGTATGVTLAKASVANIANKDKQAFVKLVMKGVSNSDATTGLSAVTFADTDPSVVLSTTATSLKADQQVTMVAGSGTAAASTGNAGMAFQFQGDTSKTPTSPWTNKDVVGATLVFTFAPQDVT